MAAAMALIGSGCAGNANRAKAVTGQADSLYLLVGSYAPSQEEGIRVYVFNQETDIIFSFSIAKCRRIRGT